MRPLALRNLACAITLSIVSAARLDAQRALTIGIGVGTAVAHARATDHTGLQHTLSAEQSLERVGRITARVDGMLLDWRKGDPAGLTGSLVLYGSPSAAASPYVIAGAGLYGIGRHALGGGNVGVGLRYRRTSHSLFGELRLHKMGGGVPVVPVVTIGVRL